MNEFSPLKMVNDDIKYMVIMGIVIKMLKVKKRKSAIINDSRYIWVSFHIYKNKVMSSKLSLAVETSQFNLDAVIIGTVFIAVGF
jgi:hypothetical protein